MHGPILISGTQRSGTTILEEVLNTHPNGLLTHELDLKHVLKSISGALFHPRHTSRKVLPFKGSYEPLVQALYTESTEKKLDFYGDKLPEYICEHETLLRFFPQARFLFCTREPYQVISSMKKRNQDAQIGLDRGWDVLSLDEMCKRWNESHKSALQLKSMNPDAVKFIGYNQLTENPERAFIEISKFADVSNLFDYSSIRRNSPRMFLNQEETEYVRGKTKDVAREFNYEL